MAAGLLGLASWMLGTEETRERKRLTVASSCLLMVTGVVLSGDMGPLVFSSTCKLTPVSVLHVHIHTTAPSGKLHIYTEASHIPVDIIVTAEIRT